MKNITDIFSNIYLNDTWRGGSGPGSYPNATEEYRNVVIEVIKTHNIKTVLDYGCGDWQFSHLIPWNTLVSTYTGVDVVPSLIDNHKQKFSTDIIKFDLITDDWEMPIVDLIICKDVLQHLPNSHVTEILKKIKKSCKFFLVTNDVFSKKKPTNSDCEIGSWRPIDLTLPPWNFQGKLLLSKDVIKLKKETTLIKL